MPYFCFCHQYIMYAINFYIFFAKIQQIKFRMTSRDNIQFNQVICGLKACQISSQSKVNFEKIIKSQKCDHNFSKFSITEKIPKPSGSIIFFKQHYEQLFYQKNSKFPSIKSICFKFFNQRQHKKAHCIKSKENSVQVTIYGNKSEKNESIVDLVVWKQGQIQSKKHIHLDYQLIPHDLKDPTLVAKTLLQKKFWIKLSADLNLVSVNINDYSHLIDNGQVQHQNQKQKPLVGLGLENHDSWQTQENSFDLTPKSCSQDYNIVSFYELDSLKITYQIVIPQGSTNLQCLELIKDCHTVKMIQINRVLNPILSQNPSILGKDGNQQLLSQQIRVLYEYLRTLSINELPKYSTKDKQFDMESYYNWRCFKTAIDQSIKTKPGYLLIKRKNQIIEKQPIGLMNALMLVKSIDISKKNLQKEKPDLSSLFRWKQFNWKDSKSIGQLIEHIYQKRQMYIRLELLDHEAIGPGSMAVLEVWPPYCCSPIHNHGQSFGLIKVLTNQIQVQNFNDLSFSPQDSKPYQSNIYQEGQFTWLSQYSYGIHRLVNPTSHTTLSLQAYMGDKGSKQFFEFIENKGKHQKYIEYYPQNDWRNFLNWPQVIGKHWKDQTLIQDLIIYINEVKKFYNLNDGPHQDFPHLALVLKKQSEIYESLTREQLSNPNQTISAQFQPLEKILE